ncbi:uncharacterized mitochondrial protein AtMg00710-like [Henckelia pumila]|uniref:uncharacterized mitochondrial protein AtMg00710-like n=1 Tax=Henckelia pumila TaxID=405737 RepID=UPI003C6E4603
MNRTLLDRVRCMLINASLPKSFWEEALSTACYLVNRCPSNAIGFKSPIEKRSETPADYSNLRVLGCLAYAHLKQDKLEARAVRYEKDSQISVNDKLLIEVESSVPDEGPDEMQDDNVTARDQTED